MIQEKKNTTTPDPAINRCEYTTFLNQQYLLQRITGFVFASANVDLIESDGDHDFSSWKWGNGATPQKLVIQKHQVQASQKRAIPGCAPITLVSQPITHFFPADGWIHDLESLSMHLPFVLFMTRFHLHKFHHLIEASFYTSLQPNFSQNCHQFC